MSAREYVGQGLAVLPLEPGGKAPFGRLVPRGLHDATADLGTLERWLRAEPEANLGIRTGEGLAVLDVDRRNDGERTLDAYIQNTATRLPLTPEVATGDGRHLYFAAPSGLPSQNLGSGLDLKAGGGYVVAPPSVHPNGRLYTWQPGRGLGEVPLAKLPASLIGGGSSVASAGQRPPGHWAQIARGGFAEGQRHAGTVQYVGHLLGLRLDPEEVLYLVLAWNRQTNRPPLPDAEVSRIVDDLAAKELAKYRRAGS